MDINYYDRPESLSGFIFGFLEEEELPKMLSSPEESENYDQIEEEDTIHGNTNNFEEDKAFWESKDRIVLATLRRSSSIESNTRHAVKEALREIKLAGTGCTCRRPVADGCRGCLQREITGRLQMAGFNCGICKSKWNSSPAIPSGEHAYLEVLDNSNSKKGEVRVIIELNFRAEFEIARANEEYNLLVSRLPEVFVGKEERLQALIRVLCSATKKCMKDKQMHMGPWRKHKYMVAKWFGTCERTALAPARSVKFFGQLPKPTASLLTFDLADNLPRLQFSAVKVV